MQFDNVLASFQETRQRKGFRTMDRKLFQLGFCLVALAMSAAAQTVTGSGTSGTVPVFNGTSSVTNSPISVSGSSVGIGTTSPEATLQVSGTLQIGTTDYQWGLPDGAAFLIRANSGIPALLSIHQAGNALAELGSKANDPNLYLTNGYWNGDSGHPNYSFGSTYNSIVLTNNGNMGIGTTAPGAKLEVSGNIKLSGGSGAAITFQDGTTQSTAWTGVVCGGDYAESVDVTGDRTKYEPGDVLVIDPDAPGKFLKSAEPYSTLVTGVYSTKPGTVGRRQATLKSPDEVPMAMVGIVPVKVTAENGPIRPGDLLVTSSKLGYAMKGTDRGRMLGAVIGKALGSLNEETGVIEVVVTLQ